MHLFVLCKVCTPSYLTVASADGRLYRCDVTPALSNGTLATTTAEDTTTNISDDEGWEEKEASRTHSVKFTDPQDQDSREVSSTTTSTTSSSTRTTTIKRIRSAVIQLFDCFNRTLRRSDSYYVLSSIAKENHDEY